MLDMSDTTHYQQLDHQLCFALYSASLAMTRRYQPLLTPLGLTYPQYLVMLALWESDDIQISALSERILLDAATLTPLLKRLEAQGLLTRKRDAADGRRVRIRLTSAGRRLKARAEKIPLAMAEASGCSPPQIGTLTRRLQTLRRDLNAV